MRCGAVTTDRGRAMGEGRPCGLWRRMVNSGVTTPQLLRARWGPLQTSQRSGGPRARGKGLPHPACLSGPLGNVLAILLVRARQDLGARGGCPAWACVCQQPACCPAAGLVARAAGSHHARGCTHLHAQLRPTPLCWPRAPLAGKGFLFLLPSPGHHSVRGRHPRSKAAPSSTVIFHRILSHTPQATATKLSPCP